MTEAVLDASVVLKWFRDAGERHVDSARALRAEYEQGDLRVTAPPLLFLEILNVAGRRWSLTQEALVQLAGALGDLGFDLVEPPLERVAWWVGRGLTAYDAAYVATAEASGLKLFTDDEVILASAPEIGVPLASRC